MDHYLCNRLGDDTNFDIVAIGSSWGGIRALGYILSRLPSDFAAPIVITQHTYRHAPLMLDSILQRQTPLYVKYPIEGEQLQAGMVYIAPPNRHVVIETRGQVSLSSGPKVSYSRPSIDVLFNSVAMAYQTRAIGVVLTGKLFDGAAGAQAIKAHGGRVLTQDPRTAEANEMPHAALQTGAVDFMLSLEQMASTLTSLVMIKGITTLFQGSMPGLPFVAPL